MDLLDDVEPDGGGEDGGEGEGARGLAGGRPDGDGGTSGHFEVLRCRTLDGWESEKSRVTTRNFPYRCTGVIPGVSTASCGETRVSRSARPHGKAVTSAAACYASCLVLSFR